ncbi:MAG TPA: TetR/AcrR family transcriptional regulator [Beutenbergiaceae bacterium]|nr:TetR/AcrR family transcriptional regulator [Beutenbergiaceae bacterium]
MNASTPATPNSDLTGRARIRDAALAVFADRGTKGTTVQLVAEQAGVSTGLIRHHFGSKAGLLTACDDYAIGTMLDQARSALDEETAADPGVVEEMYATDRAGSRYLARALAEGTSAAVQLYAAGADLAERFLSERWPDRFPPGSIQVRDAAGVMGTMHLSPLIMHAHLSQRMGVDALDQEGAPRVAAAIATVYQTMADFFDAEEGQRIADALPGSTDDDGPKGHQTAGRGPS